MKTDVECHLPSDTAQVAAQKMRKENIGFLPVCDESMRVLGTLTDRDITLRAVADSLPAWTKVATLMTRELVACHPGDEIREAQRVMAERRKSQILCINNKSRLVGVISLSDLAQIDDGHRASTVLQRVTEREVRGMN